jgi:hypothetical protein
MRADYQMSCIYHIIFHLYFIEGSGVICVYIVVLIAAVLNAILVRTYAKARTATSLAPTMNTSSECYDAMFGACSRG